MTRAISVVAVVVCLNGYNTVLDKREQAEEQLREQQAELEQEQSVDVAKEGTITDGGQRSGVEEIRNFGDIFLIARRSGGNLGKILGNLAEVLGEKN